LYSNLNLSPENKQKRLKRWKKINDELPKDKKGIQSDEFSSFRDCLRHVRTRCKDKKWKTYNISLQDLKEQWEKQKGICQFTGWQLHLPINSNNWDKTNDIMLRASLDRIDSSKGYDKGIIQFVCKIANWAKSDLTGADLIKFCHAVAKNYKGRSL